MYSLTFAIFDVSAKKCVLYIFINFVLNLYVDICGSYYVQYWKVDTICKPSAIPRSTRLNPNYLFIY